MLGRNPMRTDFYNSRLTYGSCYRHISSGIVVAIACVVMAAGCSRLGSNGPLSQKRIPFPPQPLRGSTDQNAVTAATAQTAQSGSDLRTAQSGSDLRTTENLGQRRASCFSAGCRDVQPRS